MKVIFLHGLGQAAQDWQAVIAHASLPDVECPELFSLTDGDITYASLLAGIEQLYAETTEPFALCGLSLGAILALDYAIRHPEQVMFLVLIGAQYQVPSRLIDFQNLLFRCMPGSAFAGMGLSKKDVIQLSHSMRSLDFSDRLKDVPCPAAVICGAKDRANRKASEQLRDRLPQAELHIIPSAGHEVNKCRPEAISSILNRMYGEAEQQYNP